MEAMCWRRLRGSVTACVVVLGPALGTTLLSLSGTAEEEGVSCPTLAAEVEDDVAIVEGLSREGRVKETGAN